MLLLSSYVGRKFKSFDVTNSHHVTEKTKQCLQWCVHDNNDRIRSIATTRGVDFFHASVLSLVRIRPCAKNCVERRRRGKITIHTKSELLISQNPSYSSSSTPVLSGIVLANGSPRATTTTTTITAESVKEAKSPGRAMCLATRPSSVQERNDITHAKHVACQDELYNKIYFT